MRRSKSLGLGGVAAAGVAALVLGLGTPALATVKPSFGNLSVTGPASAALPKYYNGKVNLTVRFDGPVGSGISYAVSQKNTRLISRNGKISAGYLRSAPSVYGSGGSNAVSPSTAKVFYIEPYGGAVAASTTPGKYRATITVAKSQGGTKASLTAVKDVSLNANVAYSKEQTSRSGTPRPGRAFVATVKAPYYQVGAKVTAYVKLKGKKTYAKTTSGYLKQGTRNRSKAMVKIPAKYIRSGAKYYFKVAAAPYAGGYRSGTYTIR